MEQKSNTINKKVGVVGEKLNETKKVVNHTARKGNATYEFTKHIGKSVDKLINLNELSLTLKSNSKNNIQRRYSNVSDDNNIFYNTYNHNGNNDQIMNPQIINPPIIRFENVIEKHGYEPKVSAILEKQDQRSMDERLKEVEIKQQHVFNRINNSPKWTNVFAIKNIFLLIILLAAFHYPIIILGLVGYNIYLYGTYFGVI